MQGRHLVLAATVIAMTTTGSPTLAQENPVVVMETSMGSITIELLQEDAPVSVENFLAYTNDGFYAGTVFHRVIKGFMIQAGGMTSNLTPKPGRAPIRNEARNGLSNTRGTVAMARTQDIDSATSQFFINTVNNSRSLDHRGIGPTDYGYAVFGRVTDGMDVVDKIEAVQTQSRGPYDDVPVQPVVIISVVVQ